jgi:hypothetical protein
MWAAHCKEPGLAAAGACDLYIVTMNIDLSNNYSSF